MRYFGFDVIVSDAVPVDEIWVCREADRRPELNKETGKVWVVRSYEVDVRITGLEVSHG